MPASNKDDQGVEDTAILLMSLGEEEAANVFKHLAPKEVQRLGETIARMKSITRERMDGVLDRFGAVAQSQHVLDDDSRIHFADTRAKEHQATLSATQSGLAAEESGKIDDRKEVAANVGDAQIPGFGQRHRHDIG